ncbi:glutathione peroxidase [Brevibacillus sp. NPDC058079]|uniref:glutathione peroxidase n=1 Tax=Brevibacillus sp. NPDC058079 TaxID=3346330 RepID=UPI0036E5F719
MKSPVLVFQVTSINGKLFELSAYRGKVLLIVNTASRCSYSRQFAGLQKLYESYHEKMEVRGQTAHPLFQFLTEQVPFQGFDTQTSDGQWMQSFLQEKYPDIYAGVEIKWNFTKFLIERNGHVYGRYETTMEPLEIVPVIKSLLLK